MFYTTYIIICMKFLCILWQGFIHVHVRTGQIMVWKPCTVMQQYSSLMNVEYDSLVISVSYDSDAHLVSMANVLQHFVIADGVHVPQLLQPTCCLDADKALGEGDWAEPTIKEEEAFAQVDMQKLGHVQIVGECG